MDRKKSKLDEQQERKLLEIESRGFWLAFWALLLALLIQAALTQSVRQVAGEWIVFMGMALYIVLSCVRAGIWDRRLDMSPKTCLGTALIGAAGAAGFIALSTFLRFRKPLGSLAAGAVSGAVCFAAIYIAMRLAARATKRRQDQLNAEPPEEDRGAE